MRLFVKYIICKEMKKYFIQLFLLICLFSSCENNNLHEGSYKETTSTTNGTIQNKHKKESENRGGNSSLIAWIALCVALAPHIKKLATYYLDHNGGKTHKRGEYGYHISEPDKQIMSLGEKREENEEKGGLTFGLKYDNTNETDLPTEQSPSQPLVTDMSCQTILYARESKTNILSSVESYQKGKTIYRLILESENSKTATIELCLEKNDTKNRGQACRLTSILVAGARLELTTFGL